MKDIKSLKAFRIGIQASECSSGQLVQLAKKNLPRMNLSADEQDNLFAVLEDRYKHAQAFNRYLGALIDKQLG